MSEQSTNLWERRLGDGLSALAEAEAPTATVTVGGVIDSGKRAVRRRRGRAVFGLSAALVAAAALAFGAVAVNGPGHAAPATVYSPDVASPTGRGAPLVAFGWLPATSNGSYDVDWNSNGPNYAKGVDPSTKLPPFDGPETNGLSVAGPGNVFIDAYLSGQGAGTEPDLKLDTPAGTVDGHQAWWVAFGAPGSAKAHEDAQLTLMWQYEPDAWADVNIANTIADKATGTMLMKVAENLVIGKADPRVLPFRFTTLPGGLHMDALDVDRQTPTGARQGAAAVRLCVKSLCSDDGGSLVISQDSADWQAGSTFENSYAPKANSGTADTTVAVGPHTAQLRTTATAATLTFSYDGTNVTIAASGAEYKAVGGRAGFLAFCRSITWLGADPAHWTGKYLP